MATRRQARSIGRGGSKAGQSARLSNADAAATTADDLVPVSQTLAVDDGTVSVSTLDVAATEPEALPVSETLRAPETLMETVSPEALLTGQGMADVIHAAPETAPVGYAPSQDSPPATDVVTAATEQEATSHTPTGNSPQGESEVAEDSLLPAEIESAIASAQDLASPPTNTVAVTASALTEITAANDTLTTYVRNESIATFAHWRALSTAKNPADALRLQVTELQRAADASLSCIASLARRAGRIAATLRRP
jgi:hypothetical protein